LWKLTHTHWFAFAMIGNSTHLFYANAMSENVLKFERRPQPKPPRQTPPWQKRLLVILAVVAFFAAAFFYYYLTGEQSGTLGSTPL
jgi:hypothetical protein